MLYSTTWSWRGNEGRKEVAHCSFCSDNTYGGTSNPNSGANTTLRPLQSTHLYDSGLLTLHTTISKCRDAWRAFLYVSRMTTICRLWLPCRLCQCIATDVPSMAGVKSMRDGHNRLRLKTDRMAFETTHKGHGGFEYPMCVHRSGYLVNVWHGLARMSLNRSLSCVFGV